MIKYDETSIKISIVFILVRFVEDDQVRLQFWIQKNIIEKVEILLFSEKKENALAILFALNLLLKKSEKSLIKGKNLSTIPKRLKELKYLRIGIENHESMHYVLELLND